MESKISACIYLSLAMVIVGSAMVFGKIITLSFPVFLASGLRFAIASALILPWVMKIDPSFFSIKKKDLGMLFFMAFCGQFVFTLLMLLGLRHTSAIEAGIITSTSPAMMVLVSFFLLRERPGVRQILAVLLVVVGIFMVSGPGRFSGEGPLSGHILGNIMMVGAVAGEAFFLLMRKQISPEISNLALTAWLCIAGCLMFLPFALYQALGFDFRAVGAGAWVALVYFGAVFTVLAYIFWFSGVARVSGTIAGLFTAVMPVSSVVLSCLFLKETFTPAHGLGLALVLGALFIMALGPVKARV